MFHKRDLNYAVDLLDMALMQRDKDRSLVREILIHRANANPRNLGNTIRRNRAKALSLEHPHDSVEYRIDRLTSTTLRRLAAA